MATTLESLAFDRGVRPMLEIVLPGKADAVIGFRADPDLQARIEELARKSTEDKLTEDEGAEYAITSGRTSSSPFSNDKRSRSLTHVLDDQCTRKVCASLISTLLEGLVAICGSLFIVS